MTRTRKGHKEMKHKISKVLILVFLTSMLSGCWDAIELNERLIITGLAFDPGEEPGVYHISFQGAVSSEISGGGGQGATPVFVFSGEGRTLQEVLSKMSQGVPKIISLSHVSVLIISDALAEQVGIGEFIDFVERDPKTRITMQVLIARETSAKNILTVTSPISSLTANNLVQKMNFTNRDYSHNFPSQIDDVIRGMVIPGGGPTISGAVIKANKAAENEIDNGNMAESGSSKENVSTVLVPTFVSIDGVALFKGDKLVGWTEGNEGLGLSMIRNKAKGSAINITCPEDGTGTIAINMNFSKSKVKGKIEDGRPSFSIDIKQKGVISEAGCPVILNSGDVIQTYEKTWNEKTKEIIHSTIEKAQKSGTDVLEFGRVLEKDRSAQYKQWKEAEDWGEFFSRSKVEVNVQSIIIHTQTRTNPYSTGGED